MKPFWWRKEQDMFILDLRRKKVDIKGYLLHILCSFGICLAVIWMPKLMIAALLSLTIGVWKEMYDYYHPSHCCDIWDLWSDVAGILIFIVVWWLI